MIFLYILYSVVALCILFVMYNTCKNNCTLHNTSIQRENNQIFSPNILSLNPIPENQIVEFDNDETGVAINLSNQTFDEEFHKRMDELKLIKASEHPSYEKNIECIITFEKIDKDDDVYFIPCGHLFKKKILQERLKNKAECPYCRDNIFDKLTEV